jgi:hypothetical protein
LNHGWLFEIGLFPSGGNVLLIEGKEHTQLSMDTLGDSLVSVAKIEPFCSFDRRDSNVLSLAIDWKLKDESALERQGGSMKTIFLINPDSSARKLSLEFARPVHIHHSAGAGAAAEIPPESLGNTFETELPPLSVIPLSVFVQDLPKVIEEESSDGVATELA